MENKTISSIDYTVFTDKVINELSKIIAIKHKEKAIVILKYLDNKLDKDLVMKKDLRNLFNSTIITTDKCIETLESIGGITYKETGTSYFYEITPIGEKILSNLINKY